MEMVLHTLMIFLLALLVDLIKMANFGLIRSKINLSNDATMKFIYCYYEVTSVNSHAKQTYYLRGLP